MALYVRDPDEAGKRKAPSMGEVRRPDRGYTDYLRIIGGGPPASALMAAARRRAPVSAVKEPLRKTDGFTESVDGLTASSNTSQNRSFAKRSPRRAPDRGPRLGRLHGSALGSLSLWAHPARVPCWAGREAGQGVPRAAARGCGFVGGGRNPRLLSRAAILHPVEALTCGLWEQMFPERRKNEIDPCE